MSGKSIRISIRFGLSLSFILISLILSIVITSVIFTQLQQIMREDIRVRLHDIVYVGVSQLNGDLHAEIGKNEDEQSEVFQQIKSIMRDFRLHSTDIRFVYTLRRVNENEFIFVVDSEDNHDLISHLGDLYKATDAELAYQSKDTVWISEEFTSDQWGTWLTAYAKIYKSNGEIDALLGIDISAKIIVDRERNILFQTGVVVFIFTLFFLGIGIWMAKKITSPLAELEEDIASIRNLNLDQNPNFKSIFKEIVSIHQAEGNMKKGLKSFKKFVSPELVNQLIKQNSEAQLGGTKKELTIFFSDIVQFTTLSENFDPMELTEYLKEYFAGISSIILKHDGTIDKYIGDSVMAFWGAPKDSNTHQIDAVITALECRKFLHKLNKEREENNMPLLETRFGINSGEVVVGNFGYNDRFNYTVFGDNVNIAARLESLNKYYGTDILISEYLYSAVKDKICAKKIDNVALRGKKIDIGVYHVIGEIENLDKQLIDYVNQFNIAMDLYFTGDFEKACNLFHHLANFPISDKRRDDLIQICMQYKSGKNDIS